MYQMLFIAQRKIFIVYFYLAVMHKPFFNSIHSKIKKAESN